jgi:hypothetical protein
LSLDLSKIDKENVRDIISICLSVYVWRSWYNVVTIKNKNSTFRMANIAFEISYTKGGSQGPEHPGDDISI